MKRFINANLFQVSPNPQFLINGIPSLIWQELQAVEAWEDLPEPPPPTAIIPLYPTPEPLPTIHHPETTTLGPESITQE